MQTSRSLITGLLFFCSFLAWSSVATAAPPVSQSGNDSSQRAYECKIAYFAGSGPSFHETKYLPEASGDELKLSDTGLSLAFTSYESVMTFLILRNDPVEHLTSTSFQMKDGFVSFEVYLGPFLGWGTGAGTPQLEVTCWGSYDEFTNSF